MFLLFGEKLIRTTVGARKRKNEIIKKPFVLVTAFYYRNELWTSNVEGHSERYFD